MGDKGGGDIELAGIPATQLYTEPYMVKFLVQNSLGALWMSLHPDSRLCDDWKYYVRDADRAPLETPLQAYSFTSAPIAKALVYAKKRGVDIEIILDRSQRSERYSSADFVAHAGIPTFIDAAHAIAHNKVIIVDEEVVVTS